MHIISDAQQVNLVHLLTRLLTGERIDQQEVREALSYLAGDPLVVSCPFERSNMRQLAQELIDAARGEQG